jgi:protocatechuate 3,4-dioxygenase beta subunit
MLKREKYVIATTLLIIFLVVVSVLLLSKDKGDQPLDNATEPAKNNKAIKKKVRKSRHPASSKALPQENPSPKQTIRLIEWRESKKHLLATKGESVVRGHIYDSMGNPVSGAVVNHVSFIPHDGYMRQLNKEVEKQEMSFEEMQKLFDQINEMPSHAHGKSKKESASDGGYELKALSPGTYHLQAYQTGFLPSDDYQIVVAEKQVVENIDLILKDKGTGGSVSGWVYYFGDRNNVGVQSAKVQFQRRVDEPYAERAYSVVFNTKSDGEGNFQIDDLPAGSYDVHIIADGFIFDDRMYRGPRPVRVADQEEVSGVKFCMSINGTISGVVTTSDSEPVPNAAVIGQWGRKSNESHPEHISRPIKTITDENGRFLLENLPNYSIYDLKVITHGYADRRVNNIPIQTLDIAIALDPESAIQGTVFDYAGNPVAGAKVRVSDYSNKSGFRAKETTTDTEGFYRFSGLSPMDSYVLESMYEDLLSDTVTVKLDEGEIAEVDIDLYDSLAITGIVITKKTRSPVPGFKLWVYNRRNSSSLKYGKDKHATTDSSGRFKITGLSLGDYVVRGLKWKNKFIFTKKNATRKGWLVVSLREGQILSPLEIEVYAVKYVKGKLTDPEGKPIHKAAYASVSEYRDGKFLDAKSLFMDFKIQEDGSYEIHKLPGDGQKYKVYFSHNNYAMQEHILLYSPLETEKKLDIQFKKGSRISGRVTSTEGQPLKGAYVSGYYTSKGDHYGTEMSGVTNADGEYTINGLANVEWELLAKKKGYVKKWHKKVNLQGGSQHNINFSLEKDLATEEISGTAFVGDKPLVRMEIRILLKSDVAKYNKRVTTDEKGAFIIRGIKEGIYSVTADYKGKMNRPYSDMGIKVEIPQVESGSENILIRFPETPTITGVVKGPLGPVQKYSITAYMDDQRQFKFDPQERANRYPAQMREMFRYKMEVVRTSINNTDGYFEIEPPKEGDIKIVIQASGYAKEEILDISVHSGEVSDLGEILLEAAGTVTGRLLDDYNNDPIPGVSVSITNVDRNSRLSNGSTKTDKEGLFSFNSIGQGEYYLQLRHDDYVQERINNIQVSGNYDNGLGDIYLYTGEMIQVEVTDENGAGIHNASVGVNVDHSNQRSGRTNEQGFLLVKGIPAGEAKVHASCFNTKNIDKNALAEKSKSQAIIVQEGAVTQVKFIFNYKSD